MVLDPQLTSAAAMLAAGWTMVYAARKKRMLESKTPDRRCPSCGRVIEGRTCNRHS
jgi:hypothetical protein